MRPRKPYHFQFCFGPFSVISGVTSVGVLSSSQEDEALTTCPACISAVNPFLPAAQLGLPRRVSTSPALLPAHCGV